LKLRTLFDAWLRSTDELPLEQMLATVGVEMETRPAESASDRGGKPASKAVAALLDRVSFGARTAGEGSDLRLTHVLEGGTAQLAGLTAGDVVVAIDGIRVTPKTWDIRIGRLRPGDRARFTIFRRDELHEFDLSFAAAPADTCVLRFAERAAGKALRLRRGWLGK
jgi:predicted metalloprotease with PDZ domain